MQRLGWPLQIGFRSQCAPKINTKNRRVGVGHNESHRKCDPRNARDSSPAYVIKLNPQ
jgi:hypothetical protein